MAARPIASLVFRIIVGLAVLAAAAGGALLLAKLRPEAARAAAGPKALRVELSPLERSDLRLPITSYGLVQPLRRIALAAEVGGRADSVHAGLEPGQWLERGELIVALDSSRQRFALDRLQARLAGVLASLDRARLEAAQSERGVALGETLLALERDQLARAETLFLNGKTSDSEVKRLRRTSLQQEDALRRLRDQRALVVPQLAQLAADSAGLAVEIADARRELARCTLRAPFSGRIRSVDLEQFEQVQAGTPLVTIDDMRALELEVPIKLAEAVLLLAGDHDGAVAERPDAELSLDLGDGRAELWRGQLVRLLPIDPATQTRKAIVRVDDLGGLRLGLALEPDVFCKVTLRPPPLRGVLAIPRHLLRPDGTVAVFRDGTLALEPVEVARQVGGWSVLSGGLDEGALLITTPLAVAVPGMALEADE